MRTDAGPGQFPPVVIGVAGADPPGEHRLRTEVSHPGGLVGRRAAWAGPDHRRGVAVRRDRLGGLDEHVVDHVTDDHDPPAPGRAQGQEGPAVRCAQDLEIFPASSMLPRAMCRFTPTLIPSVACWIRSSRNGLTALPRTP